MTHLYSSFIFYLKFAKFRVASIVDSEYIVVRFGQDSV